MKTPLIALLMLSALLPAAARAASHASSFRVGITVEHGCTTARTPDGGDVSLACDGPSVAAKRTVAAGTVWPRPSERIAGAPILRMVGESDTTRVVVVEY